jgi:hypothetical protein
VDPAAADVAGARRRGDRIKHCYPFTLFAAVHESAIDRYC